MADKPARADKSGKFQSDTEELIEGFEKALAAFKAKMPNHFQTCQALPFRQGASELVRALRNG